MFNFRSTSELENFPYTSFCSIYAKAFDIYRQFTLYKNICYHYNGLASTSSSGLFMVSHPHRQVGSLWSHTHIVKWALYGLTPTLSSELFMVSHPHRQVSSLWSHTHIVKWTLYGLTPTSSSDLPSELLLYLSLWMVRVRFSVFIS
jgi:hypothetical protein